MGAMNETPRSRRKTSKAGLFLARLHSACLRSEHGNAVIETAFMLPIVLLALTGFFTLTNVMHQKLEFAEAVGSGARFLSTDRGDTDPCAATATKIYAAAPGLSQSSMSLSFNINGTAYPTATCSGTTGMVAGGTATVTAKFTCTYVPIYGMNLGACSLYESSTQVIQ